MAKKKKPAAKQPYKKATFQLDAYTDAAESNSGVATGGGSDGSGRAARISSWRRSRRGR